MALRVRTAIVDLDKRCYQKLLYCQFDNNVDFKIKVVDNGTPVDLTGFTVRAFFQIPNGVVIQKNCTIDTKDKSSVTTILDNNILAMPGFVNVEFNFLEGEPPNEKTVISFSMLLEVEKSINIAEAIESVPVWDILNDFQKTLDAAVKKADTDVQKLITDANTKIDQAITNNNNKTSEMITKAQADVKAAIDDLPAWWHGSGDPKDLPNQERFSNGDYYLNKDTGDIYTRGAANWSTNPVGNIRGPVGPVGPVGPQGPSGDGEREILTQPTEPENQKVGHVWIHTDS